MAIYKDSAADKAKPNTHRSLLDNKFQNLLLGLTFPLNTPRVSCPRMEKTLDDVSVIQHRPQWEHLGEYSWDLGTNVLFSKLAEVLRVMLAKGMQGNETYVSIAVPTLLCFESNVSLSPNQEYRLFCNTQGKSGTT